MKNQSTTGIRKSAIDIEGHLTGQALLNVIVKTLPQMFKRHVTLPKTRLNEFWVKD